MSLNLILTNRDLPPNKNCSELLCIFLYSYIAPNSSLFWCKWIIEKQLERVFFFFSLLLPFCMPWQKFNSKVGEGFECLTVEENLLKIKTLFKMFFTIIAMWRAATMESSWPSHSSLANQLLRPFGPCRWNYSLDV